MSFKTEGIIDVEVTDAYVAEAKFEAKPGEVNNRNELVQVFYDVCLLLRDKDGNTDTWHGEISSRTGTGTVAHLYRSDLTLQTFREIGFNINNMTELEQQFVAAEDRTIIVPNMVGLKASVTTEKRTFTKRDGSQGEAIQIKYLNAPGGGRSHRLTMDELLSKRGMAQAAPAPAAPAPAPAPAPYPAQAAPAPYPAPAAPAAQPTYPSRPAAPPLPPQAAPAAPGAASPNCPY